MALPGNSRAEDESLAARHDSLIANLVTVFRDASVGLTVTDERGRFVVANEAFCRLTGYSQEELQQRDFASITHPDDCGLNLRTKVDLLDGSIHTAVFEKRYIHKNGGTVWVRLNVFIFRSPGSLQFVTLAEDISSSHLSADTLQRSELKFRSLIEKALDITAVVQGDGQIRYQSPSVRSVLGWEPTEVAGHNCLEFIHAEDSALATSELQKATKEGQRLAGGSVPLPAQERNMASAGGRGTKPRVCSRD